MKYPAQITEGNNEILFIAVWKAGQVAGIKEDEKA